MRTLRVLGLLAVGLLALGASAHASSYPGWADTGWAFVDKSDCCEAAIVWAQEDSMERCAMSGGLPNPRFGMRRGKCKWEWRQDAWGRRIYRCYSEASIHCR